MLITVFCDSTGMSLPLMNHAGWNGLHPADLVLPWFLVVSGYSMAFSVKRKQSDKQNRKKFSKCFRRFLKLIILGAWLHGLRSNDGPVTPLFKIWIAIFSNPVYYISHLRFFNVLQRIGVCFIFIAFIILFLPRLQTDNHSGAFNGFGIFRRDSIQWIVVGSLFFIHTVVLSSAHPSGCSAGDWTSAEDANSCNISGYIDRAVVGKDHLFDTELGWDPDGFFSMLPCMFTVYVGHHIGELMLNLTPRSFLYELTAITILCIFSGIILDFAGIPMNKQMWSASFNFMTIGLCNACLIIMYLFLDYPLWFEHRNTTLFKFISSAADPLRWVGMNCILFWILMCLFDISVNFISWFGVIIPTNSISAVLVGFFNIILCCGLAKVLYRKRIFFKV